MRRCGEAHCLFVRVYCCAPRLHWNRIKYVGMHVIPIPEIALLYTRRAKTLM